MGCIYNIESHLAFGETFVRGILDRYGSVDLASVQIFLPTSRSIKSVSDAFLRVSDGKALLLPSMNSLSDVSHEEMDFVIGETLSDKIPPAIGQQRRLFLLARLVNKYAAFDTRLSLSNVLVLARSLGDFLDMMQIAGVSLDELENLYPSDYAEHWQKLLDFLLILKEHWGAILQEEGVTDIVSYHNEKLASLADFFVKKSEAKQLGAIIIAGSTGSRASVRSFAKKILSLPEGSLVLPGVDIYCNEHEWECCGKDACHPQYGLNIFLRELGVERGSLTNWHEGVGSETVERGRFLSWFMRSGKAYRDSQPPLNYDGDLSKALMGVEVLECANESEEARLIAYHMRQALETPHVTASLVTPSRRLSVKTAIELRRWGIHVEVSAGELLTFTSLGQYFKLVADVCESGLRPIKLLGLLQHPLSCCGMEKALCIRLTGLLERYVLRGSKPDKGFAGLRKRLGELDGRNKDEDDDKNKNKRIKLPDSIVDELEQFIERMEFLLSPLMSINSARVLPCDEILRNHIIAAENFASSDIENMNGDSLLWKGEEGIRLAHLLAETVPESAHLEECYLSDYPLFFSQLISTQTIATPYSHHPRLSILGNMEARMQSADVMILGGLDEETWPQALPSDAWMSPAMRKKCGLPPLEQKIGLGAHDFVQAFASAKHVILTRSEKREGSPMAPSRWLERLSASLKLNEETTHEKRALKRYHWHKILNGDGHGKETPIQPRFAPPLDKRPQKLSVTRFKLWREDPYAIYAQNILKLRPLDAIEAPSEAAIKGQIIHRILELYIKENGQGKKQFNAIAEQELKRATLSLSEQKLLQHKLNLMGEWFVNQQLRQQENLVKTLVEQDGKMEITIDDEIWTITAIADRIDFFNNQQCHIIDYKSGAANSKTAIIKGKDPQLPIEAWMANEKAFTKKSENVTSIQIWKTAGQFQPFADPQSQGGEITIDLSDSELELAIENAKNLVHSLIDIFNNPKNAYVTFPDNSIPPNKRYNNYAYLERIDEWNDFGDSDG